jgi:hypothetical protein
MVGRSQSAVGDFDSVATEDLFDPVPSPKLLLLEDPEALSFNIREPRSTAEFLDVPFIGRVSFD